MEVFWVTIEGVIGAGKSTLIEKLLPRFKAIFGENRVFFVPENEELLKSQLFNDYCADPKRWAYQFQTVCFNRRTEDFQDCWDDILEKVAHSLIEEGDYMNQRSKRLHRRAVIISERSILTDGIFVKVQELYGTMTQREIEDYTRLNNQWTRGLYPIRPNLAILCLPAESTIDICQDRINERNRNDGAELKLVQKSYNKVVLDAHNLVLNSQGAKPGTMSVAEFIIRERKGMHEVFHLPVFHFDTTENYRDDETVADRKATEILGEINKQSCWSDDDEELSDGRIADPNVLQGGGSVVFRPIVVNQ